MFVFNDGELSQISQAQNIPYNRKTCSVLGGINVKGVADAVGAEYLSMRDNDAVDAVLEQALQHSQQDTPVIVDVNIDYSKRTRFTEGVVSANLKRFPLKEKVRFISRALVRKITH
jgi:acetolactate synthase-1/2/3 large subunit